MTTTLRPRDVRVARATTRADAEQLAAELTEALLQARRIHLKHRAPDDDREHQLRRDIACGRAKPALMILRVQIADLADGAPLSAVIRYHEAAIALLRELAGERPEPTPPPTLLPIIQRETRAQSQLDEAQHELLAHPDALEAANRVLTASERYDREQDAMVRAVRARAARSAVRHALAGVA